MAEEEYFVLYKAHLNCRNRKNTLKQHRKLMSKVLLVYMDLITMLQILKMN